MPPAVNVALVRANYSHVPIFMALVVALSLHCFNKIAVTVATTLASVFYSTS